MPSTMRDVAERAGVSIKTVSRVVNNQAEISDLTRQRVLAVIDELDYRPNAVARSLVSGRSLSIGVIIPHITDPFFPEFVLGVEKAAHEQGYSVFLANTQEDPQQEMAQVELLTSKQVDGFILYGSRLSSAQLHVLSGRHCISIVSSRRLPGTAVIRVRSRDGLQQITAHLIRLGHQAIGHVGWCMDEDTERVDGYRAALDAAGIHVDERWIVLAPHQGIEGARVATHRLLQQAPQVTAITCYNDVKALGVLQACAELGRRVPQDMAVVGFDDIPVATLIKPQLTTMRIPCLELGEMAMQQLLRVIAAGGHFHEHLEVDSTLVIRESCGALLAGKEGSGTRVRF